MKKGTGVTATTTDYLQLSRSLTQYHRVSRQCSIELGTVFLRYQLYKTICFVFSNKVQGAA
ncbi:hypothetical protein, partial [Muriicola sp.]|uniref:hypothetical protein n=1 Tax=Muriicola sp. TaxID=2020856 RepID=UPI003C714976